jgi:putative RNA 2'-phosphotransferase
VRKSHLNEILLSYRDHPFVFENDRMRAGAVCEKGGRTEDVAPPKLLFHCVRRKAYPVVCEKGIMPMGQHRVYLCKNRALALRIGKRRDPKPVLLTVQALRASQQGVSFSRQGDLMYLVDHVPVGFFTGPPLPKEKKKEEGKKKEKTETRPADPGVLTLDMERSEALQRQQLKKKGRKKKISWKQEARKLRRKKS